MVFCCPGLVAHRRIPTRRPFLARGYVKHAQAHTGQIRITSLDPSKLHRANYRDLSGYVSFATIFPMPEHCPWLPDPRTRERFASASAQLASHEYVLWQWYGFLNGEHRPLPPSTTGWLYLHRPEPATGSGSVHPAAGGLRFRIVRQEEVKIGFARAKERGRDIDIVEEEGKGVYVEREVFEAGQDLMDPSQLSPWQVPLLVLRCVPKYAPVYSLLLSSGVVSEEQDRRIGELLRRGEALRDQKELRLSSRPSRSRLTSNSPSRSTSNSSSIEDMDELSESLLKRSSRILEDIRSPFIFDFSNQTFGLIVLEDDAIYKSRFKNVLKSQALETLERRSDGYATRGGTGQTGIGLVRFEVVYTQLGVNLDSVSPPTVSGSSSMGTEFDARSKYKLVLRLVKWLVPPESDGRVIQREGELVKKMYPVKGLAVEGGQEGGDGFSKEGTHGDGSGERGQVEWYTLRPVMFTPELFLSPASLAKLDQAFWDRWRDGRLG